MSKTNKSIPTTNEAVEIFDDKSRRKPFNGIFSSAQNNLSLLTYVNIKFADKFQVKMNTETDSRKKLNDFTVALILGIGAIGIIYVLFYFLVYKHLFSVDPTRAGQFGDMFGSLNSFFSAFAFLVIAVSLYLQNKEFKLQREQLNLQRKEGLDTRDMQLAAQEAQRQEISMTRELHTKNNFESKLMFLLKNIERQIETTQGEFTYEGTRHGNLERSGNSYFDRLHTELTTIIRNPIGAGTVFEIKDNSYSSMIFNRYGLLGNSHYWSAKNIEIGSDYSRTTIRAIHDVRKTEYYNSWISFRTIIKSLREEYKMWKKLMTDAPEEIDRSFETYVDLVKSAMPFSARIFYLYLNLLDGEDTCNDFIYEKLYSEVESTDFFHGEHKSSLFNN